VSHNRKKEALEDSRGGGCQKYFEISTFLPLTLHICALLSAPGMMFLFPEAYSTSNAVVEACLLISCSYPLQLFTLFWDEKTFVLLRSPLRGEHFTLI
jgi:hypothetical protein